MVSYTHRRQVLLFLVAVVLPCTVLVALGVFIINQERELREGRLADERRLTTIQIREELSARLGTITQDEAARIQSDTREILSTHHTNPAVVLVAHVRDGSLALPWTENPDAERSRRLLNEAPFTHSIVEGERAEFAGDDARAARVAYERALNVASYPEQRFYAQLLLGRALSKLGDERAALLHYQAVLASSSAVIDEFGIALWSYAAARLLEAGPTQADVVNRVADELDSARWFPPTQLYLFRDLVEAVTATVTDTTNAVQTRDTPLGLADRIATTENASTLEREITGLPISLDPADDTHTTWVLWDRVDWLVGVASYGAEPEAILLAVRAHDVFETLEAVAASETAVAIALEADSDADGELLGAGFPGLKVHFAATASGGLGEAWNLRRWFYLMAVLLVVSATLFGAYLLWSDVRRELEMADMRSRFVSSVSHELKTPLTAIRMFAETLRLRAAKPETQAEYLDTIVSESERLSRLLNNVLDFTKIERGAKIYRREPHTLDEIVNASARAMRYPLEQLQFRLHVNVNDGIPSLNVDRDAIEQAILNLLANAMKYSDESREIDLSLEKVGTEAVIQVADRGVGIAAEEQVRIFEQFYRANTKENQHIPGTGLGLTLVDHIARAHDGYVTVESELGKGSRFAIHLPLGESQS